MASRTASRHAPSASSSPAPPRRSFPTAQPASTASPQLRELRRQWKWAAVSQFLNTFAQLVALEDVSLVDIEEDLVNSTMIPIPRLMQRLLVTLTQDRKISVDNWQSALRRQYVRRDPAANPIGLEPAPLRASRAATVETDVKSEGRNSVLADDVAVVETVGRSFLTEGPNGQVVTESGSVRQSGDIGTPDERTVTPRHSRVSIVKEEDLESPQNAQDIPKDWANLSMLEKLESLHMVVEWHFQSPLRLRSTMRSDDEDASWRIEPIGYDAKRNAYWLIGADRLWIQRIPPKPPKKSTKRKAVHNPDTRKAKVARVGGSGNGKKKHERDTLGTGKSLKLGTTKGTAAPLRAKRGSRQATASDDVIVSSPRMGGRSRAAKTQANARLDLQAKQLAATKAELESLERRTSRSSPTKASSHQAFGIRVSRRLRGRGDEDDEEWQQIPDEWLRETGTNQTRVNLTSSRPTGNAPNRRASARNKRILDEKASAVHPKATNISEPEGDDESDLTELSDSEPSVHGDEGVREDPCSESTGVSPEHEKTNVNNQVPAATQQAPDFIEWETLCISLQEWEEISHRFEKASHYLEKALHKVLIQEVVPFVTEALREAEKLRIKEDALLNRKRSSRIAIKEMGREAARLEALRRAEENDKMARMRRLEGRVRREEEERLKREQAREQRRKEREDRELARNRRLEHTSDEGKDNHVAGSRLNGTVGLKHGLPASETHKPSRHRTKKKIDQKSAASENWELDCEICGSKGINRGDGVPLMSCGRCNKWQHINCHDAIDRKAGRPLRDWDAVDFFCKHCRMSLGVKAGSSYGSMSLPSVRLGIAHEQPADTRQGYGFSGMTNGIAGSTLSTTTTAGNHQSRGSSSFAGFAHYHPHHGFSPNPSLPQQQNLPQSRVSTRSSNTLQSPFPHRGPLSWDPRVQGGPSITRGPDESIFPHHEQNARTDGPTAYNQQPHGVPSVAPSVNGSTQNVHYPPSYLSASQQRPCSNPTTYHPQM